MEGNTKLKASAFGALWWHLLCGSGIPTAFWVAHRFHSVNLISCPHRTLLILWVIQCPFVILLSSFFRINPGNCSYLKAVGRGLLGLLAGALVFAVGAISLGAPVGSTYMLSTINWSLLMSLLTVICLWIVCAVGSLRGRLRALFLAYLWGVVVPAGSVDFMVCLPANGSIVGAWFGAWPMPLDWERPWQEWPICVTYVALVGYLIGMVASFVLVFLSHSRQYVKVD